MKTNVKVLTAAGFCCLAAAAFALTDDATAIAKAKEILAKMTLEEKASLCGGNGTMTLNAIPRVGIMKEWYFCDSSHTVRANMDPNSWACNDTGDESTVMPTLQALASTWNTDLATAYGHVIGEEARARGKDQMLGPGVNLMRTPLCGRNWEYMSEDPCLTAKLVVPEVRALQSHDVAACVKHFALNGQELARNGVDTLVDDRTLHEIYLPAFKAAIVEGEALTLMTSYNRYNGDYMSENAYMLRGVLRDSWGFLGSIVTDWGAQHSCEKAALNGAGIEMNMGPDIRYLRDNRKGTFPIAEAVKAGRVPPAVLDDMALRVLYVMAKVNFFDEAKRAKGANNTPEHQATARAVGEEAIVLLKNDLKTLPLDPAKTRRILLVGNLADTEHCRDGWSAEGKPLYEITPAKGLEEFFAKRGEKVVFERAPLATGDFVTRMHTIDDKHLATYDTSAQDAGMSVKAWQADFWKFAGEGTRKAIGKGAPAKKTFVRTVDLAYGNRYPFPEVDLGKEGCYFARFTTKVVAPETGNYMFSLKTSGSWFEFASLDIGGSNIVEWALSSYRPVGQGAYFMEKGKTYDFAVDYRGYVKPDQKCHVTLGWLLPSEVGTPEELKAKAKAADAVLVFTGTTIGHGRAKECEGGDRPDLKLPDGTDEALATILSWKLPNVVVVNHSGAPVEMPWVDECPTLVQTPYLGQESGRPLARVLFGEVNPSGKLTCTWPKRYEDTGVATCGTYNGKSSIYNEGFYVGYRWFDKKGIKPMFPFGHGLSYTTFEKKIEKATKTEYGDWFVVVSVRNTGKVAGKEVVELFATYPDTKVERCVKELKGFAKTRLLKPGESESGTIVVEAEDLRYYDAFLHRFEAESADPVFVLR